MKNGKNETFRDKLQDQWSEEFLQGSRYISISNTELPNSSDKRPNRRSEDSISGIKGIIHLCPRSGKIRTSIRIFCKIQREIKKTPKILILYPDANIKRSWEEDFVDVGYKNPNIEYSTFMSLNKVISNQYDIIVCDEIHLLSEKQKENFLELMNYNPDSYIMGLSGTLSNKTKNELRLQLGLEPLINYSIDEAVKDGLISDYRIKVVSVDLDNQTIIDKKKNKTEKQKYNAISWVIKNKGQNLFLSLSRMRIMHNSLAKAEATKQLLNKLKDERVLVFCAGNKIAKDLGIQIHTSMFKNQEEFEKFIKNNSSYNHMAVCKIGNTGTSFRNLNNIIVNAFDSNSENLTQRICRSLILDEKDKISNIYIVCSTEKVERKWLDKALEFFDKNKIEYLKYNNGK